MMTIIKGKTIVLIGFLICTFCAKAQWSVGISVGYDYNMLKYDMQWVERSRYSGYAGQMIEMPVTLRVNEWMNMVCGLSIQEKGYVFDYLAEKNNRQDVYVTMPIMMGTSVGGSRVKSFCNIGGYASYWLSSCYKGIALMHSSAETFYYKKDFVRGEDNRIEAGLAMGMGISYDDSEWKWFLAANYYHALTNQYISPAQIHAPAYNRTITFQVGVMYKIK